MNWSDQVAAFRGANLVVGPHGAGLSNLVFSAPGTTLIELTSGQIYNRCFEWISHVTEGTYVAIDSDAYPNSSDPHRLLDFIQRAYPKL
jgi:capsular polysaccharide biosynthesis protein